MNLVNEIALEDRVSTAMAAFESNLRTTVDLAVAIQQIPSPTFDEGERAAYVESLFTKSGLDQVHRDDMHNVFGQYTGSDSRTPVVISAHLDTVFPIATDLAVSYDGPKMEASRIYGPGLGDNSLGVAGLITLARTLTHSGFRTESDIWLVANVAEEGLGNLNGMRAVVDKFGPDATYLVIEGGSFGLVFHEAIGVNRFLIEVRTPGGHSWGDFGKPNAIHVLSSLIDDISNLDLPDGPKTTYNVGVIEGGTTVNAIASSANCQLDLRSAEKSLLENLTSQIRHMVKIADDQLNIRVDMTQIGERPSGRISRESTVVKNAAAALEQVGYEPVEFMAGSTDASVPIGLGIPSVCIGLAKSGNTHRLDEFIDITYLTQGLQQLLLLTLATSGLVRE